MIDPISLAGKMTSACGQETISFDQAMGQEWVADIPAESLLCAIETLKALPEWRHLSTITGLPVQNTLQILYHCWLGQGVTLRVTVPQDKAIVPSVVESLPGAQWYEREIREMLGVTFSGLPELDPLLLNDRWDSGPPLLNKDDSKK